MKTTNSHSSCIFSSALAELYQMVAYIWTDECTRTRASLILLMLHSDAAFPTVMKTQTRSLRANIILEMLHAGFYLHFPNNFRIYLTIRACI